MGSGPYTWGNGPKPKPKGILAKLLDLAVNGGNKNPNPKTKKKRK